MDAKQCTQMYEQATALAEAGQHESALSKMFDYLVQCPQDGCALNDAATLLYCLGRTQEAIAYYEKACQVSQGDQLAHIYWNLCEAYLQDGRVGQAIGLFDAMESANILTSDVLNRAANMLLEQDSLGPAVELLLRSLQVNGDQEILNPMIEVIVSKRARVALAAVRQTPLVRSLAENFSRRLPLKYYDGSAGLYSESLVDSEMAIFVGCGPALADVSSAMSPPRLVAVLEAQDILSSQIQTVNWSAVHTAILCGGADLDALFREQVENLPDTLRLVCAEPIADPERTVFSVRKKGKRIAAVGPWDATRNPMLALMCFQKLHFLDPDMRLHLADVFIDPATERYVRSLIETLELDNVVFLDSPVNNLKKWLKDKHYILSTSIDGSGLDEVWTAAAMGLRPVVHRFPGVEGRLPEEWLFTLAEEFCEKVRDGEFDSVAQRIVVERQFVENGLERVLTEQIFRFEKERSLRANRPTTQTPACTPSATPSVSQIASEALAVSEQLKQLSRQFPAAQEFKPADKPVVQEPHTPKPSVPYNHHRGLSVEDLMESEGRRNVPFSVQR